MKAKTKLIMSIMSICLVCAVFAIGVFALKTANLKIGGDVSFSATGVEAKIKNATLKLDADSQAQVLATGEINTSMTQGDIDNTFENWQTLELDFNENAENIVFKFDIVNTSANLDHYIEIDYTYSFNNENPNVDVVPGYYTQDNEYVNNEYILAPKGQTPADGDYQTFILNFVVLDKEINVPDNTKVNLTIKLKHHKVTAATDLGGVYAFDGLVYVRSGQGVIILGAEDVMPEVVNIPPVIKIADAYYQVKGIDGASAFGNNTIIKSITLPASMTSLSSGAFTGCTNLENISIPKSITVCGDSVTFFRTAWLNNQPDGCVYINNVLYGYKGTMPENTKIKVKEGTISIVNDAFKNYTNLTGITFPDTLKSIETNVFSGCTGITSIVIPKNLTEITAVSLPRNLASIVVAQDNPKYDSRNNCNAIIEKQTNTLIFGCKNTVIPNNVTSIGDSAFSGCEITSITLPNGLKSIGYMAFAYSSLTSITIPSGVTTIGAFAFAGSDLTTAKFDNPSNWIRANSATATTGTAVTVTSDFTEANATELKKEDGTYLLRKTA